MTLVELLARLEHPSRRDQVLAAIYFSSEYRNQDELAVADIRALLTLARVSNARRMNISDVLSTAGHLVDRASGGWRLTASGRKHVRDLLGFAGTAETVEDAATLSALVGKIADEVVRSYVEEAIACLKAGALRAAAVFLWTGAIRHLEERVLVSHRGIDVTSALRKHDPKARAVSKVPDFANVKDSTELLAFRELGVIDKGEWQTLKEALDLRNRCGHPTKYRPGLVKVSAFVEDVIGIAFA